MTMYPMRQPATDRRLTIGLLSDVADVLQRHGYPAVRTGSDRARLGEHLRQFLYEPVDVSATAAAAEVPPELAPRKSIAEIAAEKARAHARATFAVAAIDPDPRESAYTIPGDAEKSFDVEQAYAEGRELRAEEEAELAAERGER